MNPKYPFITYTILYDAEKKLFSLWNDKQQLVAEDINGRELGRDAWRLGAEMVRYNYDLTKDENLPLKSYDTKYRRMD